MVKINHNHKLLFIIVDRADNTWEPFDNLDCPDLIGAFEDKIKKKKDEQKKRKKDDEESSSAKKKKKVVEVGLFLLM